MKTRVASIIIVFLGIVFTQSEAARILGVFPSPSKSHVLIHCAVADALAEAGHNVTVIGSVPNMYKKSKYQYLHIEATMFTSAFAQEMLNKPTPIYKKLNGIVNHVYNMANETLSTPKMANFLKTHKAGDFDVVILGYFYNEFMLGIGAHFQCPIILSWMIQPVYPLNAMIGNPLESSYVPTLYSGFKQPMDFCTRVKNFLAEMYEQQILGIQNSKLEKFYRKCDLKYYNTMREATVIKVLDELNNANLYLAALRFKDVLRNFMFI